MAIHIYNQLKPLVWVRSVTSLSVSTIYREINAGRFPRPVRISAGRVAWDPEDIQTWLDGRLEASRRRDEVL